MNKFITWLVVSSADPSKLSLTVKGFLVGVIPFLTVALPLLGFQFDVGAYQEVAGSIVEAVQAILGAVALAITAVGFIRKIRLTFFKRQ